MITKHFLRSAPHEHADPAQRVLGAAQLAPDSDELAHLLAADPAPEVRAAAARRCADLNALAMAWETETDSAVRVVLAAALSDALAETQDSTAARKLIEADACTDEIRADVARRTRDGERRLIAIAGIRSGERLVDLALTAGHAETRMAAAERVRTPEDLRRLADAARSKDHGVARLARQRVDAMEERQDQKAEADAILAELETLATRPGPILTAVVELNRRWEALDMSGDAERLARCDAARQTVVARFEREQEEQRARARFEHGLREWIAALAPPATPDAFAVSRSELAALRDEAQQRGDAAALSSLDEAEQRIALWEQEHLALAGAEALVAEAEQLAAGTSIDDAQLPERWQVLNAAIRTPELTRRFEAALRIIEHRRDALVRAAQQEASAVRQNIHSLLHAAEQALAAGQLHPARVAADEIRKLKGSAGPLPKPTTQRLGRLVQQLVELERWESFGQQNARVQLCERAEALATQTTDMPQLALDVQKLRSEWKALDQQYAGVPKALWKRFDGACEKAYAPAAKYFAAQAALRKQARKQRDEFIAAAAAHAPTLLGEVRDWRAIERWLRDTEHVWHDGDLGSVEPRVWKKLDTQFKAALAPLRDALSAAREQAKAGRQALIEEAVALAPKAMERDTLSHVKAIQARWQEQAKAMALERRDERALWEQFRAACDAVFTARDAKRKEADGRKHEHRRALEDICAQLEQLALAGEQEDQTVRRVLRELQEQWKKQSGNLDSALRGLESRFRAARTAVEAALSTRVRSREAAVWQTLAAKERLCEELEGWVRAVQDAPDAMARSAAVDGRWTALPALPAAWEQKMVARRDAALRALTDATAAADYQARIENGGAARRERLLELELLLDLDSPAEFQSQRRALQLKQLRERFRGEPVVGAETAGERLLAWCAQPGYADALDRQRCERVISKIEKMRVAARRT